MDTNLAITQAKSLTGLENSSFLDNTFIETVFNSCYRDVFNQWTQGSESYNFRYIQLFLSDFNAVTTYEYQIYLEIHEIRSIEVWQNNKWNPIDRVNVRETNKYGYKFISDTLYVYPSNDWSFFRLTIVEKPDYIKIRSNFTPSLGVNWYTSGVNLFFDKKIYYEDKIWYTTNVSGTVNININSYNLVTGQVNSYALFNIAPYFINLKCCIEGLIFLVYQDVSSNAQSIYTFDTRSLSLKLIISGIYCNDITGMIDSGEMVWYYTDPTIPETINRYIGGVLDSTHLCVNGTTAVYARNNCFMEIINNYFYLMDQNGNIKWVSPYNVMSMEFDYKRSVLALYGFNAASSQSKIVQFFKVDDFIPEIKKIKEIQINDDSGINLYKVSSLYKGELIIFTTDSSYNLSNINQQKVSFEDFPGDIWSDLFINSMALEFLRKQHGDLSFLQQSIDKIKERIKEELKRDINSATPIRRNNNNKWWIS